MNFLNPWFDKPKPASYIPLSDVKISSHMDILLSSRYRNLRFLPDLPEDQAKSMYYEKLGAKFVSEGIVPRSLMAGAGGYALGLLFGGFFFTMKPMDIDTTLPFREQVKQSYKGFLPEVHASAKNFAKIGFIYSTVEAILEKSRATKDHLTPFYSGCVTGGALAYQGGAGPMVAGCLTFAAFSCLVDHFLMDL